MQFDPSWPKKKDMDEKKIQAIVNEALNRLIAEQVELLERDVTERALSHYLARYIAELIPMDLQVDIEYNRHGVDPKRLKLPPRKALDRELRATTVFPDILVHKRGTNKHNILVLEMKKPGEDLAYDELKLKAFKRELHYAHAAHVIVGKGPDGEIVRRVIWVDD